MSVQVNGDSAETFVVEYTERTTYAATVSRLDAIELLTNAAIFDEATAQSASPEQIRTALEDVETSLLEPWRTELRAHDEIISVTTEDPNTGRAHVGTAVSA